MKKVKNEAVDSKLGKPLYGKRDYYFHADEDFREDREWGKIKLNTSMVNSSAGKAVVA